MDVKVLLWRELDFDFDAYPAFLHLFLAWVLRTVYVQATEFMIDARVGGGGGSGFNCHLHRDLNATHCN